MDRLDATANAEGPLTRGHLLTIALVSALFGAGVWWSWWLCDDAFISFTYARRLAEGHGLRYNLGTHTPVEGYSNLAWVLLAAVCEAVGWSSPGVMPWLSATAGLATLVVVYQAARRLLGVSRDAALCVLVCLAVFPPFTVWATGGLATMPLACVMSASMMWMWQTEGREDALVGILWALCLVMLRTEGLGWAVWLALCVAWGRRREGRDLTPVWVFVGAALVFAGAQAGFRGWHHGGWLSNTASVKLVAHPRVLWRGLAYVCLALATWGVPLLALGAWRLRGHVHAHRAASYLVAGAGVVLWSWLVGGDYLPFHRFLVPVWPLWAVPLALGFAQLADRSRGAVLGMVAVVVTCAIWPVVGPAPHADALFAMQRVVGTKWDGYRSDRMLLEYERIAMPRRRAWARAIMEVVRPGSTFVARGVGALGYDAELFVYDVHGLVSPDVWRETMPDRLVAPGHDRRVSRAFFLDRAPDYLFAFPIYRTQKGHVSKVLPDRWGLFEDLGDGLIYGAEWHVVEAEGPHTPPYLVTVRRLHAWEDRHALREAFKQAVRASGFRAPKLEQLDTARRESAWRKRHGDQGAPTPPQQP